MATFARLQLVMLWYYRPSIHDDTLTRTNHNEIDIFRTYSSGIMMEHYLLV